MGIILTYREDNNNNAIKEKGWRDKHLIFYDQSQTICWQETLIQEDIFFLPFFLFF